jgi:hypothetical protein
MFYLIQLFHLILIVLPILSVFLPFYNMKIYALTFLIFILIHYITNFNKCGITELEYFLSNKKYEEGFCYRLIKPIISIPEKYFDNYLFFFHILWIVILYKQIYLKIIKH